jgi:hypothetical protein
MSPESIAFLTLFVVRVIVPVSLLFVLGGLFSRSSAKAS